MFDIEEFKPEIESGYALIESHIPPPAWSIESWHVEDGMTIIGGPPKSRKSTLLFELAASLTAGVPFLGHYQMQTTMKNMLIVQEENTRGRIKRELEAIMLERGIVQWVGDQEDDGELVYVRKDMKRLDVVSGAGFNITNEDHWEWLLNIIEENEYGYVAFDPLYMIGGGMDINSAKEVVPVLRALTALKERAGCVPIVVHHQSEKGDRSGKSAGSKLMGSTFLHGWYEVGIFPSQTKTTGVLRVETEFREMMTPEPHFISGLDLGKWMVTTETDTKDKRGRESAKKVGETTNLMRMNQLLTLDPTMTNSELSESLEVSERTVRNYRQKITEAKEKFAISEGPGE